MSAEFVVFDVSPGEGSPRVGEVLDPGGVASNTKVVTVRWENGIEEKVARNKRYVAARRDSLSFLQRTDAAQLHNLLQEDPAELFALAAANYFGLGKPASELKRTVADAGFDLDAVSRAWDVVEKQFEGRDDISFKPADKERKYLRVAPTSAPNSPVRDLPNAKLPRKATLARVTLVATVAGTPRKDLRRRAASAANPGVPPSKHLLLEDAYLNPLAAAGNLATWSREQLADLVGGLGTNDVNDLGPALMAGAPKSALQHQPLLANWLPSPQALAGLERALGELERVRQNARVLEDRGALLGQLAARIMEVKRDAPPPPATLARLFVALRRTKKPSDARHSEVVLNQLAIGTQKPLDWLSQIDVTAFASELGKLPLRDGQARVALLIAIHKADATEIEQRRWWENLRWEDFSRFHSGPLSAVLGRPAVLDAIVRPLVKKFVESVTTRRAFGELLAAPAFALEHLDPSTIASLMESVSSDDRLMGSWRAEIAKVSERDVVVSRLSVAEEHLRLADISRREAEEKATERAAKVAELSRDLKMAREEHAGLSSRERRQVILDAVRAMAQVAAMVDADGARLEHPELMRKVNAIVERHGLSLTAHRGEQVAFDPVTHSAPGVRPEPGEKVNVARPGYKWSNGEDQVVVLPALVARVEN